MRLSTFRLLARGVGFWGGSGAHSRRFVGAGGSGGVLWHSLGNIFGWSVSPTRIDLGGKGDRGEDGCDGERSSHKCVVEDNIFIIYEDRSLFIPSFSYEKPVLF